MTTVHKYWYASGCGRIEICLTLEEAEQAYHQGQCYEDVKALMKNPDIAAQLDALSPDGLRKCLDEYSDWDTSDHEENKLKILWIAAGNITERCFTGVYFCELSPEAQQTAIDNYGSREALEDAHADRLYDIEGYEAVA